MASRYKNITIDQGADFRMVVNAHASQDATSTIDSLADEGMNSYEVSGLIRKSYYHANSELTFIGSVASFTNPATVLLELTRDNTSSISPGRYVYDIELLVPFGETDPPGNTVIRILEGIATVTPEVTR